jgi:hypothetical protein
MTETQREEHHIAYVIPGFERSGSSPKAPLWEPWEVTRIIEDHYLFSRAMEIAKKFIEHVGISFDLDKRIFHVADASRFQARLSDADHNQKRMTRILKFLRALDMVAASRLLTLIGSQVNSEYTNPRGLLHVTNTTFNYWNRAVREVPPR